MRANDAEYDLTQLLAQASVQHLKLTLEPMKVGEIIVDSKGMVERIDRWTQEHLSLSPDELKGIHISRLFESCDVDFTTLLNERTFGYVGQVILRTRGELRPTAALVLVEGIPPFKPCFSIFYTDALT
ncbi:MAG: hypothetical protein ACRD3W_04255 [Terriglobales bacterium]